MKSKAPMFKPNIYVIDTKGKETKTGFITEEEANDYIETHERPEDLVCEFDVGFKKRKKEQWEKKQKAKNLEKEKD